MRPPTYLYRQVFYSLNKSPIFGNKLQLIMGIDTRKIDFIKKVSEMNAETFVQIENLVAAFLNSDKEAWYDNLSNTDLDKVDVSMQQAKEGKLLDSNAVHEKMRKMLAK